MEYYYMPINDTKFAFLKNTNDIVDVDSVKNGNKCGCVCIACGENLQAKHGKINKHHFAHQTDSNCPGGTETLLHLLTKDIIEENRSIYFPTISISPTEFTDFFKDVNYDGSTLLDKHFFGKHIPIKNIKLEKNLGNIKPDLIAEFYYNGQSHELLIEVAVTHFIDEDKADILIKREKNCIEIDMRPLILDIEDLTLIEVKNEIQDFLNNDKDNFKIINQEIIDIDEEKNKLNLLIKNKSEIIKTDVTNNLIQRGHVFLPSDDEWISHEVRNCFGIYTKKRHFKAPNQLLHGLFNIEVKENSAFDITGFVNLNGDKKPVALIINRDVPDYMTTDFTVVYYDIDTRKLFELDGYEYHKSLNYIIDTDIKAVISFNHLFDKEIELEKTKNSLSLNYDVNNFKNLISSLSGKIITLPNPSFESGYAEYRDINGKTYSIEVENHMRLPTIKIKVLKVQFDNKNMPNILKVFYHNKINENKFLYIIFHTDKNYVDKLNIVKNKYKHKNPILHYTFPENGFVSDFSDLDWSKNDLSFNWILHTGFEKIKSDLFKKVDSVDNWSSWVHIFMQAFNYKLESKVK